MSAKSIIQVLRNRLRKQIADLYADQNKKNVQYLVYDIKHMRLLIRNAITTFINSDSGFAGVTIDNFDAVFDKEYRSYVTKSTVQKIYQGAGFKFVPAYSTMPTRGKIAYFDPGVGGDMLKIMFPLPESRAVRGMSKLQKGQPLPNVYDSKVTFKGPNQKLVGELFTRVLISALELQSKTNKRGTSFIDPSGAKRTASSLAPVRGMKNAMKLHGGDSVKFDPRLPLRAEATTAYLVDIIEQLKSGKLKGKAEKASGKVLNQSDFDTGLDYIIDKFDAEFTINNTTISDITKNKKEVVVGTMIGDRTQNARLMRQADKPALRILLNKIATEIATYFSTNPGALASKSMKDLNTERGAQAIIKGIFGPLTKSGTPDMRFKANRALLNKKGTKTQTSAEFKEQFAKLAGTVMLSKAKAPARKAEKTGKYNPKNPASDTSLAALMQMVNKSLPRHLKRNMEPPALQYRGRGNPSRPFAGPFNTGVRVQNIRDFKDVQGGLDIEYTYEKYPYQTFEPGFEKGSVLRDPRKLIEESIRDIMIERKQTRFLNMRRI